MKHFIVRSIVILSVLSSAIAAAPVLSAQAADAAASQPQVMPASLQDAYSAAVSQPFVAGGSAYGSEHNGLTYSLSTAGLQAQGTGIGWDVSLQRFGRGNALQAVRSATVKQSGAELQYMRGSLTEWYRNLPFGLEQGFSIDQAPAGIGKLTLQLDLKSNVSGTLSKDSRGLSFTSAAGKTLRYDQLKAYDAAGTELDAEFAYTPGTVLIQVDDHNAAYPITIDPFIYLEQRVMAPEGTTEDFFGASVALSGDTALVGAGSADIGVNADQGAAYVFVRSAGAWNLAAKLHASDGTAGDVFGGSVALDGDTALIGASHQNTGQGAAYVFVKPVGGWVTTSTFTAKLTASDGASGDDLGASVSLSGDTALIGAPGHSSGHGAAYVFVKPGGGWATTSAFDAELTASDGAAADSLGTAVALSGDTAVAGAPEHDSTAGAAYVFVKPGGGWVTATETAELTSGAVSVEAAGASVAISGGTILVGAPLYAALRGTAYLFVRPGGGWTTTSTWDGNLFAPDGANGDQFGMSVALSGDTAMIGAPSASSNVGAAYIFVKSNGTWFFWGYPQAEMTASDGAGGLYGNSLALSGDQAVIGSPFTSIDGFYTEGAAYFYAPYADYALTTGYSAATASPGDTVYLTASVTSYGPTYADFDLAVNAPMPAGLTASSAMATNGTYDAGTGVWSIGTFPSGTHATLTITATVNVSPPATIPFTASLTKSDIDNSNNTDTAVLSTVPSVGFERLSNGGFNTYLGPSMVPAGWLAQGLASTDGKDTVYTEEGSASVRMDGAAGQTKLLAQFVPVSGLAGDHLNFSFWVQGRSIPTSGMCVGAVILINGGTLVSMPMTGCAAGTTNGFIKRTLAITAPANYTAALVVFAYAKAGGSVWFDGASLIK